MTRIIFQKASSGFRAVRGELIKKVQKILKDKGLYTDVLDGIYGNNTEAALIAYQNSNSLPATGKINDLTWQKLTSEQIPSIEERCLQLTADFEGTGFTKIVGNFDGAGLTWGIIGFTLVHGELKKIIDEVKIKHPSLLQDAFGENKDNLLAVFQKSLPEQLAFANSISLGTSRIKVREPWGSAFETLGNLSEVQAIQIAGTQKYWDIANRDFQRLNLKTELGLALCFDTAVQNGGIDRTEVDRIQRQIDRTPPTTEQDLRRIISNVVAENSNPRFIEDVRKRKLAIATTQGTVHGANYEVKSWGLDEISVSVRT
jgi:Putative peptidoglycan binding domain